MNTIKLKILLPLSLAFDFGYSFEIEPKKVNVGSVTHGKKIETVLTIVNTNEHDITWIGTHSSCGCEVLEISKSILRPNDVASLKIVFSTEGFLGTVSKDVALLFLDNKSKPISSKFHLDALVESSLEIDPPVLLFSYDNQKGSQFVKIKSKNPGPVVSEVPAHLSVKETGQGAFEVKVDYEKLGTSPKLIHTNKIRFTDPVTQNYFNLLVRVDVHPHPLKDELPMDLGSIRFKENKSLKKSLATLTDPASIRVLSTTVFLNNKQIEKPETYLDAKVDAKSRTVEVKISHPQAENYGYIRAVVDLADSSNGDRKYSLTAYAYLQKSDTKTVQLIESTDNKEVESIDE